MNTKQIISAVSVEANNKLFASYKTFVGDQTKTRDDFYEFLSNNSDERDVFFSLYAEITESAIGDNIVILNAR